MGLGEASPLGEPCPHGCKLLEAPGRKELAIKSKLSAPPSNKLETGSLGGAEAARVQGQGQSLGAPPPSLFSLLPPLLTLESESVYGKHLPGLGKYFRRDGDYFSFEYY